MKQDLFEEEEDLFGTSELNDLFPDFNPPTEEPKENNNGKNEQKQKQEV